MAQAAAKKKKKDDPVKIVALVVVIVIGVVGFFKSQKPKSKSVSTSRPGAAGGAPGAPGAGGGAEAGSAAAITVTPANIPQLTPEIKLKIQNRVTSESNAYPISKLEQGQNPFIPFNAVIAVPDETGSNPRPGGPARVSKFNRKILFWGAFSPGTDEPPRVIVEVAGEPQPWTGSVGETVDGAPYRVKSIADNGKSVRLEHVSNPKEPPLVLRCEGDRDESGKFRAEESDTGGDLFSGAGAKAGAAASGRKGGEPAFER